MTRNDWFRNKEWNANIEAAYRAKLSRSRSGRPQYLTIQASYLSENHPTTALSLIDEYFDTGDEFHMPVALCIRAQAYRAMGQDAEVITAYKQALDWEKVHPYHISNARTNLPKLIAERRLYDEYDYALDILISRFSQSDHQFPATRYLWNGSCALIAHEKGEFVEAREFAERAIRAAKETMSPFRYHRKVGLVKKTSDDFGRRIKRIAAPPKARFWMGLFSRS